jgi:hypothetical protein
VVSDGVAGGVLVEESNSYCCRTGKVVIEAAKMLESDITAWCWLGWKIALDLIGTKQFCRAYPPLHFQHTTCDSPCSNNKIE